MCIYIFTQVNGQMALLSRCILEHRILNDRNTSIHHNAMFIVKMKQLHIYFMNEIRVHVNLKRVQKQKCQRVGYRKETRLASLAQVDTDCKHSL